MKILNALKRKEQAIKNIDRLEREYTKREKGTIYKKRKSKYLEEISYYDNIINNEYPKPIYFYEGQLHQINSENNLVIPYRIFLDTDDEHIAISLIEIIYSLYTVKTIIKNPKPFLIGQLNLEKQNH